MLFGLRLVCVVIGLPQLAVRFELAIGVGLNLVLVMLLAGRVVVCWWFLLLVVLFCLCFAVCRFVFGGRFICACSD